MSSFISQVDDEEMRVRPSHKRCIVILREIDGSTPAEEVRAIFEKDETLPKMLSCDYAHNNVWYLTFESDDDAQKAYHYIRDHVKEYKVRHKLLILQFLRFYCVARQLYFASRVSNGTDIIFSD